MQKNISIQRNPLHGNACCILSKREKKSQSCRGGRTWHRNRRYKSVKKLHRRRESFLSRWIWKERKKNSPSGIYTLCDIKEGSASISHFSEETGRFDRCDSDCKRRLFAAKEQDTEICFKAGDHAVAAKHRQTPAHYCVQAYTMQGGELSRICLFTLKREERRKEAIDIC